MARKPTKIVSVTRDTAILLIAASLEAMDTITPPETSEPERAAWLDRVEDFAVRLPFRFVRKTLAGKPTIALIGDGLGDNVPSRLTIWMRTFAHIDGRDRFHVWLASRLDRWEAWGEAARSGGGPILSQHLFALHVADPSLGERIDPFRSGVPLMGAPSGYCEWRVECSSTAIVRSPDEARDFDRVPQVTHPGHRAWAIR